MNQVLSNRPYADHPRAERQRRLPYVIRPLPDEPFDSWVKTMAHAHQATIGEMSAALGLTGRAGGASLGVWATQLSSEQLDLVAETTGLPSAELRAMTRMDFAASAIRLTRNGRISPSCPSSGVAGRYCPECLADSDGRWRLSWQFPFGFACMRHNTVLVDRCPGCNEPARQVDHPVGLIPKPGFCHNRTYEDGKKWKRCGQDLREGNDLVPTVAAVQNAQRMLLRVVSSGRGTFGIYESDPQPAIRVLEDMALLSRAARKAIRADAALGSHVVGDALLERFEVEAGSTNRRPELRPSNAILVAVGNAVACWGLEDADRVRELLWSRISTNTVYGAYSAQLQRLIAHSLGRRRRPTEAVHSGIPLIPSDPRVRAAKLPAVLWEPWVAALAPRRLDREIAGGALSAAVVFAGTRLTHGAALALLDRSTPGRQVTHVMRELGHTSTEARTLRALARLAEYLDQVDTPIDFDRRRWLDYSQLLPREQWSMLCAETNYSPGGDKRWLLARTVLYKTLSGNRTATTPFQFSASLSYQAVSAFSADTPPAVRRELARVARQFLNDHDIDEPVNWYPPPSIAGLPDGATTTHPPERDTGWPIATPARERLAEHASTAQLAAALAAGQSVRAIAAETGVSRQTIGRVLATAGVDAHPPGRARMRIDEAWLRRRYEKDLLTLREIASEVGVHTGTISRHLQRAGIPARPRGSASRAAALRADPRAGASPLLQAVLRGQASVQRAERFLIVVEHSSIAAAARHLGITQSVLGAQMNRLSDDAGGALMKLAAGSRPHATTALGRRLARALRSHLADARSTARSE